MFGGLKGLKDKAGVLLGRWRRHEKEAQEKKADQPAPEHKIRLGRNAPVERKSRHNPRSCRGRRFGVPSPGWGWLSPHDVRCQEIVRRSWKRKLQPKLRDGVYGRYNRPVDRDPVPAV